MNLTKIMKKINSSYYFIPSFLLVLILQFYSCQTRTEQKSVEAINFDKEDYVKLNEELSKFKIPELSTETFQFKYKYIATNEIASKINNYVIYAGTMEDESAQKVHKIIEENKIFINQPISENILFRFKLGDDKTFRISQLKPTKESGRHIEVDNLNANERRIQRMNGYYYFQDLTVYKDPSKEKRKFKEGKLVFFNPDMKMLLFYNDRLNY